MVDRIPLCHQHRRLTKHQLHNKGVLVLLILYLSTSLCGVDAFLSRASQHCCQHSSRSSSVPTFAPKVNSRRLHVVPFVDVGTVYSYCLDHYYYETQAATGAFCAAVGDMIAQYGESKEQSILTEQVDGVSTLPTTDSFDPVRNFHYFLKGIGGGMIWAYWFNAVEPYSNSLTEHLLHVSFADRNESSMSMFPAALMPYQERIVHTFVSIMMEQFIMSPLVFTFWDIPLPALLRGAPMRQIPSQIQNKLIPLMVANAKVWTFANIITYSIPVDYRVVFSSLFDIVWQSINASITSKEVPAETMGPPLLSGSVASNDASSKRSSQVTVASFATSMQSE